MKLFNSILLILGMTVSYTANAVVIDFTTETTGNKANGYTVSGVTFTDTMGSGLQVADWAHQSHGNGLAVFGDDTSALNMTFDNVYTSLSMDFGNDHLGYANAGDVALLTLYLGGVQVGATTVALNLDDIMNQTIAMNGIAFDEAQFVYADAQLNAIALIEIVDNIAFDGAVGVPETGTLFLLAIGLLGLGSTRRLRA